MRAVPPDIASRVLAIQARHHSATLTPAGYRIGRYTVALVSGILPFAVLAPSGEPKAAFLSPGDACSYAAILSSRPVEPIPLGLLKHCRRCSTSKPVWSFNLDRSRTDGRFPICKACRVAHDPRRRETSRSSPRSLTIVAGVRYRREKIVPEKRRSVSGQGTGLETEKDSLQASNGKPDPRCSTSAPTPLSTLTKEAV